MEKIKHIFHRRKEENEYNDPKLFEGGDHYE